MLVGFSQAADAMPSLLADAFDAFADERPAPDGKRSADIGAAVERNLPVFGGLSPTPGEAKFEDLISRFGEEGAAALLAA